NDARPASLWKAMYNRAYGLRSESAAGASFLPCSKCPVCHARIADGLGTREFAPKSLRIPVGRTRGYLNGPNIDTSEAEVTTPIGRASALRSDYRQRYIKSQATNAAVLRHDDAAPLRQNAA